MSRQPEEPAAEPAPVDLLRQVTMAVAILAQIGSPEATAAIDELAAANRQMAAAFRRASDVILAVAPTPPTAH